MHHVYPRHPTHLEGSKWSSLDPNHPHRHWEVESYRKKSKHVVLRATLDSAETLVLPWRELRDRSSWLPGWHNCEGLLVEQTSED
ncbi:MAG: TIGR02450 family Trp-rich protein [Myxococcota bacterium]